jgi:hypothetical protein
MTTQGVAQKGDPFRVSCRLYRRRFTHANPKDSRAEVLNRKTIEVDRIKLMVELAVDAEATIERLASRAFRTKDGTAKFTRGAVVAQTTGRAR